MNDITQQLPSDFVANTRTMMGASLWDDFLHAMAEEQPVSVRLNPLKTGGMQVRSDVQDGRVPWCAEGFYLRSRPAFTFDPLLHAGAYYVQEAASMFVCHVLRQFVSTPVRMLDLCAAPGGKSTAALTALPHGSRLVSNEPVGKRAQVLAENLQKWGAPGVTVTNNLPRDFRRAGEQFDVILTDVPCSGEGMFRKDPAAIGEWSLDNVKRCQTLQREIVDEAWQCLAPGGLLVYSTCTYNTHENEENVSHLLDDLGAVPQEVEISAEWGITGALTAGLAAPVYRFIPGRTRSEGLFMAVVLKPGEGAPGQCLQRTKKPTKGLRVLFDGAAPPLRKGKDLIPDTSEALCATFDSTRYPASPLSYSQALQYLRRESLTLDEATPRGIVTVTYGGLPLGFVKNIGTRANNLYPAEWKIKSTHLPDEAERPLILTKS